jgi:UPF0755 protein
VTIPPSKIVRIALVVASLVVLLFVAATWWLFLGPNPSADGQPSTIFVSRGQTFLQIVDSLSMKGIIRSKSAFVFVARILGGTEHLHTGKYVVASGTSNTGIYLMLRSGRGSRLITVWIPEGYRVQAEARAFSRALGIDSVKYAKYAFDPDFAGSLGIHHGSLEGYLLPDTYEFSWQQDERDILPM